MVQSGFLKIVHAFNYQKKDSLDYKLQKVESTLRQIKDLGYDGIVSNVNFKIDYLDDPDEWACMERNVQLCKELGLRAWIYDESGYPSGAAGTKTLDKNVEFHARAAVMVSHLVKPGEAQTFTLPRGHKEPISAFGYFIDGERITQEELQQGPIRSDYGERGFFFENSSDKNLLVLCFFEKFAYEGTHSHHNCAAAKRYIDIGNADAIREFADNTYYKYYNQLKPYFEDGVIEATFTDEPSYMGAYINPTLMPDNVVHECDDTLPLYPIVSWTVNLPEVFWEKYQYHIADHMVSLFLGNRDIDYKVRKDFYTLLSDSAKNAYFHQLSNVTEDMGTRFSGHILYEEKIANHVALEGNFFELLKNMHIPGMDMLTSIPEKVWEEAFTPSMVRSISEIYREGHVLDEVSAHRQNGIVSQDEILTSILLQYALGADIFASYYSGLIEKENDFGTVLNTVQYVQKHVCGRVKSIAGLMYPIDTVMGLRKPQGVELEQDDNCFERIAGCEKDMLASMYGLIDSQVPFVFCDCEATRRLLHNQLECLIVSSQVISDSLTGLLRELHENGTEIVYFCQEPSFLKEYGKIDQMATLITGTMELRMYLRDRQFSITYGDTEGVACMWTKDNKALFCNSTQQEKNILINRKFCIVIDCKTKEKTRAKEVDQMTTITLNPYQVVIVE